MGMMLKTKQLADQLADSIKLQVTEWKERGIQPAMCTILVKGDPASEYYAKVKEKLARKLGIAFHLLTFDDDVTERRLLEEIDKLNSDSDVHGIMLELPVPKHISVQKLSDDIFPLKDVDGISSANKLACMTGGKGLFPATPQSCIRILQHFGFPLRGSNVTLIGRGETVGRPLMHLLLRENATLTICHSHTKDLSAHIAKSEILISAAGKAGLVTCDMVHPELVVIDAGINDTGSGITGDVSPEVFDAVKAMTPVPGGVGTLTSVILFENLMKAMVLQKDGEVNKHGGV
ncbi:bifunctional 5,10-methylenetetrahydrofolate dehydrogenase/5,10-methenyltetrahydrofolate cyclohydrolase [Paenibacillus alkalitolerans]|uniref:bifunctional 5,10-methylenetetrahydrofolate dehydrogenase/5,10-methenyltetrahydrofolate cyclohydrolase n=1 Tax=Paenibacillus alkalitolerans TaxID=2799335 RepID=UPI0018F57478|nr:tetrahydrofolate dehydrogenase/cyclohydrolase catalytic domain-containing protein [Paenibacillus alkalitolerans]